MSGLFRFLIIVALAASSIADAQEALSGEEAISSYPQQMTAIDGALYFSADDGVHGRELWMTDEMGNLCLAADIVPGPGSSSPGQFCGAGGLVFFATLTLAEGNEPWVYDRVEKKARILKDIIPGPISSEPVFGGVGENGLYLLTRGSESIPSALWTIRLSPVELVLLANLPSRMKENTLAVLDDGQLLVGLERCLMSTDGTSGGTRIVYQTDRLLNIQWITALNDRVVFAADAPGCGNELWVSNGTPDGTRMIRDIRVGEMGSMIAQAFGHDGRAYLRADDGEHGLELWVTDGTTDGTCMVKDINPGRASSDPHYFVGSGNSVYFAASDDVSGTELWRSDGSEEGTTRISNLSAGGGTGVIWSPIAHQNQVFFCGDSTEYGEEVFRFTPATGGVSLLKDIVPGPLGSGPDSLTSCGAGIFFVCNDGIHGEELWLTSGAEEDICLPLDIRTLSADQSASSSPRELTAFEGKLLFSATEMAHGTEMWISDGSSDGTVLVADIAPGPISSDPQFLTVAGSRLFFSADDQEHGRELWCSDGSSEGTRLVADITAGKPGSAIESCTTYDGALYCTVRDTPENIRVMHVDPATLELRAVTDASPPGVPVFSTPSSPCNLKGTSFFAAYTPEYGRELWKTTGTTQDMTLLTDIFPGRASSCPTYLATVGGMLLFIAEHPQMGRVLFQCDGTPTGTIVCRPFARAGAPWPSIQAVEIAVLDDRRAIIIAPHPARGEIGEPILQVMSIEGERAVLDLLGVVSPGPHGTPHQLTPSGALVYFTHNDSVHGEELWATDGTQAGTRMVKDILSSSGGSTTATPGLRLPARNPSPG